MNGLRKLSSKHMLRLDTERARKPTGCHSDNSLNYTLQTDAALEPSNSSMHL